MAKYVIKATITTDNPESDLAKLNLEFGDKVCATFDALPLNWEDAYDGYEICNEE